MDLSVGFRLSKDEWFARITLPFIFTYLNSPDLLRAAQVCQLWRDIAAERRLWKKVSFKNNRIFIDLMVEFLVAQKTVSLSLVDCIFVYKKPDFLIKELHKLHSLRSLELCKFRTRFIHRIPEISNSLQELSIKIIDEHFTKLNLSFLQKLPHLQSLTVDCSGREIIPNSINNLDHLRKTLKHFSLTNIRNIDRLNFSILNNLDCLTSLEVGSISFAVNQSLFSVLKNRTYTKLALKSLQIPEYEVELINTEILELIDTERMDLILFKNLKTFLFVPMYDYKLPSVDILANISESKIQTFVLGIRSHCFASLAKHFDKTVADFFDFPIARDKKQLLLDAFLHKNFANFLAQYQAVLTKALPKIKVSVIDYHDKWSGCNWMCKTF